MLPYPTENRRWRSHSRLFGITVIGFINRVLPSYPISIIVLGITRAITRSKRAEEFFVSSRILIPKLEQRNYSASSDSHKLYFEY